ncbi:MAG: thiamine pyrophosphate-dependent dehydrogenase E1 component subunit alpha [Oscillospiraceae bacterium]|nr:thiamine pyrophosphate-dependent dehydrogenase E1 component subunit alpha [Oscillospiraceae bacterium]
MSKKNEQCRQNLKTMMIMREFERVIKDLANEGFVDGAVHCYTGEEACALGVCLNLNDDDYVFSTHRGHGHAIAKGLDLKKIFAELMGKASGVSGGYGGSMHLFDTKLGFMGGNGIVGGGVTVATGTAYASKYLNDGKVTVCFFSEGASNEGWCHEAMNMASLWKLPIIFACENNLFAATTPSYKTLANPDIFERAKAYDMVGVKCDGNDLDECIKVSKKAIDRARRGEGPTLIEFKTYRVEGHCRVIRDLEIFRPKDVVAWWADHDPIKVYSERLVENGVLTEGEIAVIAKEVDAEIKEAIQFGKDAPRPSTEEFLKKISERYAI